jgi:REP element-mobilizing transposase RayT
METMEVGQDPIHGLVSRDPHLLEVPSVRQVTQESLYALWQHDETMLKPHVWQERIFGSDGQLCCLVANASQEVIRRYSETYG